MEYTKDQVHYIVFYRTGEIKELSEIEKDQRLDKQVVFKRKFLKKSSGQDLYNYHETEVLNSDLEVSVDKKFSYEKVTCKIVREQYWSEILKGSPNNKSMFMEFEITDLLNQTANFRIPFGKEETGFNELKLILDTVNRVGTVQGAKEILTLIQQRTELETKINDLKSKSKN